MRESNVRLLYDPCNRNGIVKHHENGIWYEFNVEKVMFSSGNLTEKMRMSHMAKSEETILDLYAGIGYFSLSFLVHANVRFIYCCEINPYSIQSLKKNMMLNKIDYNRYRILEGDNRETSKCLVNCVHRVCLGLLPSSEDGYIPAMRALNVNGGYMHIHHNIAIHEKHIFLKQLKQKLRNILQLDAFVNDERQIAKQKWKIDILHCEHVKWYAPKVSHSVIDVKMSLN